MRNLRVFWPQNSRHNGTLIGWLHDNVVVIATVVESESNIDIHGLLEGHEKWLELKEGCRDTPVNLGRVHRSDEGFLSITFEDKALNGIKTHFVLYARSSLYYMQFYSVSPLQLDITIKAGEATSNIASGGRLVQDILLEPGLRQEQCCDLRCITRQMNASAVVEAALNSSKQPPLPTSKPRVPSQAWKGTRQILRLALDSLFGICNLPLFIFDSTTRLKDVSATIQQFDVRLEQFSFFPSQVRLISTRSRKDIATYSAQYINFYNNVWLIFNDVVIGTAVGTALCENHQYLGQLLYTYTELWTVRYVIDALTWLDDWPVGLKLNTELSRALHLSFMAMTNIWGYALNAISGHLPLIIYLMGLSGSTGLTMILSLSSDLLSLLTIHIYLSYLVATTACHRILLTAGSLWNLFRGKRYNVLQNRLDSWDYSLDQLLLGTMLFTLVAFLSPTIVVYYGLFAAARLVTILMHALSETILAVMNHFPLFVLMLRIKDSRRLPGGIHFRPTKRADIQNALLTVKSVPIAFSRIFFQYLLLWGRLSSHYHPVRLIGHVATASFINPIPRYSIRYSMLPVGSTSPKEKLE